MKYSFSFLHADNEVKNTFTHAFNERNDEYALHFFDDPKELINNDVFESISVIVININDECAEKSFDDLSLILQHIPATPVMLIFNPNIPLGCNNEEISEIIFKPLNPNEIFYRVNTCIKKYNDAIKLDEQRQKLEETSEKHKQRTLELFGKHIDLKKAKKEIQHQNKKITLQHKEIQSSIGYARMIQNAVLPQKNEMNNLFNDYFILNKPKDIVSGDYYWVKKYGHKNLIMVADCTGHGVPGAFMSLLGISLLNEIFNQYPHEYPGFYLNMLKQNVIHTLHQTGNSNDNLDGMDAALVLIDKKNKCIHFAGAHNPIYIVHKNKLTVYKGNRMPVGISMHKNELFQCYKILYQPGDMLFMFTDGFADQFGGSSGNKYRYKPFREFLQKISVLPSQQQKKELELELQRWQGNYEQIDDILILGIRL